MTPSSERPYPPLELANRVLSLDGWGKPFAAYERLGAETRAGLLDLLPKEWSFAGKRVLDFGCGAGRTLRHFLDEAEEGEIWGADIDAASIAWIQRELSPPLKAIRCGVDPPLGEAHRSFDLIWAISVFTHLTDNSLPWLAELQLLLRPGGSDWWVREHWGRAFELLSLQPLLHGQSWALLRRRDLDVSVEDLERPGSDPRELTALRHNVRQLQREQAATRAAYEGSASWRLTRPLRAFAARARSARSQPSRRR